MKAKHKNNNNKHESTVQLRVPLSVILTNKLNPSEDFSPRRCATIAQNSLARVLESTSKAWKEQKIGIIRITKTNDNPRSY